MAALTLEEYVLSRNKQDAAIRHEFCKVDEVLGEMRAEFNSRIDEMLAEFDKMRAEFDEMRAESKKRFGEIYGAFLHVSWLTQKNDAVQYNSRARPWMRPKPPPLYDLDQGLSHLPPDECPASIKSSFKLRDPKTPGQFATLLNLAQKYGVDDYQMWGFNGEEGESDCESDETNEYITNISLEEATRKYPRRAVEKLAGLWGLDEESYDDSEARRAALLPKAGKRSRESKSPRDTKRQEHGQPKLGSQRIALAYRTSSNSEDQIVIPNSSVSCRVSDSKNVSHSDIVSHVSDSQGSRLQATNKSLLHPT